jgi:hypothetical protein
MLLGGNLVFNRLSDDPPHFLSLAAELAKVLRATIFVDQVSLSLTAAPSIDVFAGLLSFAHKRRYLGAARGTYIREHRQSQWSSLPAHLTGS